jgi:hypothetical protein
MGLAGCSRDDESVRSTPAPIAVTVSRATWTDGPWPLTVSEGVLRCRFSYRVTFTAQGAEYALNSAATSSGQFPDIGELLPDGPVGYVTIDDTQQPVRGGPGLEAMLARGLDLCD